MGNVRQIPKPSPADALLRKARAELRLLLDIERAHAEGDYRNASSILEGLDPEQLRREIDLISVQLGEGECPTCGRSLAEPLPGGIRPGPGTGHVASHDHSVRV